MDIKQLRKLGGSYYVVIPVKYVKVLGLCLGDYVRTDLVEDVILMQKVDLPPRLKKEVIKRRKGRVGSVPRKSKEG